MKARKTCSPVRGKKVFHRAFLYAELHARRVTGCMKKGKGCILRLDEKENNDYPLDMRTD